MYINFKKNYIHAYNVFGYLFLFHAKEDLDGHTVLSRDLHTHRRSRGAEGSPLYKISNIINCSIAISQV